MCCALDWTHLLSLHVFAGRTLITTHDAVNNPAQFFFRRAASSNATTRRTRQTKRNARLRATRSLRRKDRTATPFAAHRWVAAKRARSTLACTLVDARATCVVARAIMRGRREGHRFARRTSKNAQARDVADAGLREKNRAAQCSARASVCANCWMSSGRLVSVAHTNNGSPSSGYSSPSATPATMRSSARRAITSVAWRGSRSASS